MTEPSLHHVQCADASGGHRMAYWQWGPADAPHVVVCVHGLTRQGRDFDSLARALCQRKPALRVVCPDVVGRGGSDWLKDPEAYQIPMYAADMLALLAQLHGQVPVQVLDWVGTSMGGLIGLAVFGHPGLPLPAPLHRMVINDVGPALQWRALQRIGTYVGQTGHFASVEQAAAAMWLVSTGFGPHSPEQWMALSRPMVKALPQGGYTLHYDPALATPFRSVTEASAAQGEAGLWQLYDQLRAEVLLLRGEHSDLLTRETAQAMTQRGPRARLHEFAGIGHAPTLVVPDQLQLVGDFLLA